VLTKGTTEHRHGVGTDGLILTGGIATELFFFIRYEKYTFFVHEKSVFFAIQIAIVGYCLIIYNFADKLNFKVPQKILDVISSCFNLL
jgi:hypothetical protein